MRKISGSDMDCAVRSSYMLNYKAALVLSGVILGGAVLSGCRSAPREPATGDMHNQIDPLSHKSNVERRSLGQHLHDTILEFRPQPMPIVAGQPNIFSLKVIDMRTKRGVADFKLNHEKLMHLIVVSKDLTWFNHVHPDYIAYGAMVQQITLPRAGSYKLYADYTPLRRVPGSLNGASGSQEVAQKVFEVSPSPDVTEATFGKTAKLVADKPAGGWITKVITAHPESEPDAKPGDQYQVALMPMPATIRAGEDAMLHFQIRDAAGNPVKDLQPYLGAMGHAVILSEDSEIFLHSHPMEGGHDMDAPDTAQSGANPIPVPSRTELGGPDVMFHTNFPAPGLYKVWGQFQHKDLIITAPFVVKVEPGAKGAVPKPHVH